MPAYNANAGNGGGGGLGGGAGQKTLAPTSPQVGNSPQNLPSEGLRNTGSQMILGGGTSQPQIGLPPLPPPGYTGDMQTSIAAPGSFRPRQVGPLSTMHPSKNKLMEAQVNDRRQRTGYGGGNMTPYNTLGPQPPQAQITRDPRQLQIPTQAMGSMQKGGWDRFSNLTRNRGR